MAKKAEKQRVKCIDCDRSELMQWDNNPIIAKCPYLLYKQVANAFRTCVHYRKGFSNKTIKKLTHLQ